MEVGCAVLGGRERVPFEVWRGQKDLRRDIAQECRHCVRVAGLAEAVASFGIRSKARALHMPMYDVHCDWHDTMRNVSMRPCLHAPKHGIAMHAWEREARTFVHIRDSSDTIGGL